MKTAITLQNGVVHKLPQDFASAIQGSTIATNMWLQITPLARNEWICWVENAKKSETRQRRIEVGISKMTAGMRRPCCWVGCMHRDKTGKA